LHKGLLNDNLYTLYRSASGRRIKSYSVSHVPPTGSQSSPAVKTTNLLTNMSSTLVSGRVYCHFSLYAYTKRNVVDTYATLTDAYISKPRPSQPAPLCHCSPAGTINLRYGIQP